MKQKVQVVVQIFHVKFTTTLNLRSEKLPELWHICSSPFTASLPVELLLLQSFLPCLTYISNCTGTAFIQRPIPSNSTIPKLKFIFLLPPSWSPSQPLQLWMKGGTIQSLRLKSRRITFSFISFVKSYWFFPFKFYLKSNLCLLFLLSIHHPTPKLWDTSLLAAAPRSAARLMVLEYHFLPGHVLVHKLLLAPKFPY